MTDDTNSPTRCPGPRCAVGGCDWWHMSGLFADPGEPRPKECRIADVVYDESTRVEGPTSSEWAKFRDVMGAT